MPKVLFSPLSLSTPFFFPLPGCFLSVVVVVVKEVEVEEAATFISLHNGKGERTLFSLLFSYPPFFFDRGRAGGGGGRREEGKRLLGWHGRRRIANSCNITAHRSKETFGTRSRVSRMCCVPCLISWRNPCQREAGKCQKLRGGRESFLSV